MAIVLEVEDYCQECADFDADVSSPERMRTAKGEAIMSDTLVRCAYRNRCRAIKRYLEKQKAKETDSCEMV